MRIVRIVNVGGTGHQKASTWSAFLDSGDEVAGAFEINFPYFVFVFCTKQCGQMNNCRHAYNGRRQRVGTEDVSFDRRNTFWKFFTRPHEYTAFNACFYQTLQESWSKETRTTSN